MTLELIGAVVLGNLSSGALKVASAPADALAEHWKARIKARLDRTSKAAGFASHGRPIEANDRVAFKALSEAAFNDDELVADYLGGVLAGSTADDDAGVAVVALIGRLSALQLKLHYLIYRELRRLWPGTVNLSMEHEARTAGMQFQVVDLIRIFGNRMDEVGSAISVLHTDGLISGAYKFGVSDAGDWVVEAAGHRPHQLTCSTGHST
jgi:hypothetical protein